MEKTDRGAAGASNGAAEQRAERRMVARASGREAAKMLLPFAGIFIALALHLALPNVHPAMYTPRYWAPCLLVCAGVYALFYVVALVVVPVRRKLLRFAWLLCVAFLLLELHDLLTLKSGILKMPFIPSPDKIIQQLIVNLPTIVESAEASLALLFEGLVIGIVLGFASGVLCGCSRLFDYWLSPFLKVVGPVPGLVWLPVFVLMFDSSRIGSVAAIVIAAWFPMTLMLSNAIKNTDPALVERAETLGASKLRIIFSVMVPNAVPALANALFMALSGSFGALSAAELSGVKTGLALAVRQMGTIAIFGAVFAYVGVMILIFSTLTVAMFAVRNWLLRWQKGLVRW